MNKLFKTIGAISLGLAMAAGVAVGVGSKIESVAAVEKATKTYDLSNSVPSDLTASISLTKDSSNRGMGASGKSYTFTGSKSLSKICKVVVNAASNYSSYANHSISVTVGSTSFGTQNLSAKASTDYTFTGNETDGAIVVAITNSAEGTTSKNSIWTKTITCYSDVSGASVSVDKESVTLDENPSVVTATPDGVTNPVYSWSIKDGSDDCVTLSDTTSAAVTITPKQDVKMGEATVVVSVSGTGLETPVTAEVSVSRVPSYTNPLTVAEAKNVIDNVGGIIGNMTVAGKIYQIDSFNSTFKSIQYWISDDGTETNGFEVYSGRNYNNTDFSSVEDLTVGMYVVVRGSIKKYNSTYEFDKSNYIVACAENYSSFFLSDTGKICSTGTGDNLTALQGIWSNQKARYDALTDSQKALLMDESASQNMKDAMARYSYVCGKYNTASVKNLEEYIAGATVSYTGSSFAIRQASESTSSSVIIIIAIALGSVTGLGVLLALKRRKGLVK